MAISFICGKPGGGKGLVCMQQVIDELRNGDRPIITNLAIRIAPWVRVGKKNGRRRDKPEMGLKAYLLKEYGKDFDCEKRVHLLTDEQAGEFYLYRVVEGKLVKSDAERENGKIVAYDTSIAMANGGVLYCVDEAWKFFGARDWANTGKGVLFYGAQHRKLGDTLLICTQFPKQVDTGLRGILEDVWQCTNHSKKKLGVFRQPDLFSVAIFDQVPTGTIDPMSRKVFKLDKAGLGGCYDTAGGVGIVGAGSADIGERSKGIPFAFVFVLVILIGAGVIFAARGSGWLTGKLLGGGFSKNRATRTNAVVQAAAPGHRNPIEATGGMMQDYVDRLRPFSSNLVSRGSVPVVPPVVEPDLPSIVGTAAAGQKILLCLSDGGIVTQGDGRCSLIELYRGQVVGAVVDGVRLSWAKPARPSKPEMRSPVVVRSGGPYAF